MVKKNLGAIGQIECAVAKIFTFFLIRLWHVFFLDARGSLLAESVDDGWSNSPRFRRASVLTRADGAAPSYGSSM